MHEIHIAPQALFEVFGFSVSNSLFTTWIGLVFIALIVWLATKNIEKVPSKLQLIAELVVETLLNLIEEVTGDKKKAEQFLPFISTFFIFVLILNWMGLIPGVGSIYLGDPGHGGVSVFRPANTDLNTTFALAVISVMATQFAGIAAIGFWKQVGHYINLKNPIEFFVGILHLMGEVSKTLSFSFRLFGNVFAGEVLLIVLTFLIPYIAPVPFYGLEIFVGFIQALVFTMLTLVFLTMATSYGSADEHGNH